MRKLLAAVVCAACVAGCGGGSSAVTPTVEFSRLDDFTIDRFVRTGVGGDGEYGIVTLGALSQLGLPTCPEIAVDGGTTTYTGPCQVYVGAGTYCMVEGRAQAIDGRRWVFEDFSVNGCGNEWGFFDGTIEVGGNATRIDLSTDRDLAAIHSAITVNRQPGRHEVAGGVGIVDGDGALVSGSIATSGDPFVDGDGIVMLRGEETLEVQFSTGNCARWQIVETGRTGQTCGSRW